MNQESIPVKTKSTEPQKNKSAPPTFVGFQKGRANFRMDNFKLEVANMKHNLGFKIGYPQLKDQEHAHWFKTVDRKGKPQTKCIAVGGHWHDIIVHWDKPNPKNPEFPLVEVGPPMKMGNKTLETGVKVKDIQPVAWFDNIQQKRIYDTHTHEVTYHGFQILQEENNKTVVVSDVDQPPPPVTSPHFTIKEL